MSDLTLQMQRFVDEYLVDLNGKAAAIRAGYSAKTAEQQASRLLRNVKVLAALAEGQKARSDRTKINADWVLMRLVEEAEADLSDLYDDNGQLKPMKEWPKIWRKGLVAGIETLTEFETVDGKKERVGVVRKVRLSDRIKRVELIGKHVEVQAFRERVAHENPDGTPMAETSNRELAKAVAYVLSKGLKADD